MRGRIAELQAALEPCADCEDLKVEAILKLFIALRTASPGGGVMSEAIGEAQSAIYLDVLADLPGFAVAAGAMAWLRGDDLLAGENPAFVPTPPQLRRLAKAALVPLYREIAGLQKLGRAVEDRPPGAVDKRAVEALLAAHGWRSM